MRDEQDIDEQDSTEITEMRAAAEEHRKWRNKITLRHYVRMLEEAGFAPKFELLAFEIDDYGTTTIGRWGGWLIQIVPMGFNDRIVLNPESFPGVYDHGWCYDKGGAAFLAAIAWDPVTEAEPPGYKKRATWQARQPGETASSFEVPIGVQAFAETLAVLNAVDSQ